LKNILFIIILIYSVNCYSQTEDCDDLRKGTFEIFEKGEKLGIIYRKDNLQIEKYPNNEELFFVKLKFYDCNIILNTFEIKEEIDTITWSITYKKIDNGKYKYIGKPKYLNIPFTAEGNIEKISNKIDKEILEVFSKLKLKKNN